MFGRGCLYLGREEEAHIRELRRQRDEQEKREINIDPEELPMLEAMRAKITEWNDNRDGVNLHLHPFSS